MPDRENSDFDWSALLTGMNDHERFTIGEDDFQNLEIRHATGDLHYFYDTSRRTLIKQFVMLKTTRTVKVCEVTLIKNEAGMFIPRLALRIRDTSSNVIQKRKLEIEAEEDLEIKASVDIEDCSSEFWSLVGFLGEFGGVKIPDGSVSFVSKDNAELVKQISKADKKQLVNAIASNDELVLTEEDIVLISGRKSALETFDRLLTDPEYFEATKAEIGRSRDEDVWQDFFEHESWIFGYGLSLVSCEGFDDLKLEQTVGGADDFGRYGKRIDALMKTRSLISSLLFCEIKTPGAPLLDKSAYRSGVHTPCVDLRGGVAQVQTTIDRVVSHTVENFKFVKDKEGAVTVTAISLVKPRGVLIVGRLSEFQKPAATDFDRLASFERYRESLHGLEVITFDELYERARFIVDHYSPKAGPAEAD